MLKIDQEWIKRDDADIKNVEYVDEMLMLSLPLRIYKYENGQQRVVPLDKKTGNPRLSRSDLSLATIVAEALYDQIGEFTLELPQIKGKIKMDSYSHGKIEGAIMASVAEALRNGDISLF